MSYVKHASSREIFFFFLKDFARVYHSWGILFWIKKKKFLWTRITFFFQLIWSFKYRMYPATVQHQCCALFKNSNQILPIPLFHLPQPYIILCSPLTNVSFLSFFSIFFTISLGSLLFFPVFPSILIFLLCFFFVSLGLSSFP